MAIFSDGIESIVISDATDQVNTKFFDPIFTSLHTLEPSAIPEANNTLASFLDSPSINKYTDDDKSLIVVCF